MADQYVYTEPPDYGTAFRWLNAFTDKYLNVKKGIAGMGDPDTPFYMPATMAGGGTTMLRIPVVAKQAVAPKTAVTGNAPTIPLAPASGPDGMTIKAFAEHIAGTTPPPPASGGSPSGSMTSAKGGTSGSADYGDAMHGLLTELLGFKPEDITDENIADLEQHFDKQASYSGAMLGLSILNSLKSGTPVQAELADAYKGMKSMRDNLPMLKKQLRTGTPQVRRTAALKLAEMYLVRPSLPQTVGAMATQLPSMIGQISYGRDMAGSNVAAAEIQGKYALKGYELSALASAARGQDFGEISRQIDVFARIARDKNQDKDTREFAANSLREIISNYKSVGAALSTKGIDLDKPTW